MCKEMMEQRSQMEELVWKDLERCLENIRSNGCYDTPIVLVDMEQTFIANREYFEQQGFFFDPQNRIENGRVRYFSWMKLGSSKGNIGEECWRKIKLANEEFIKNQRQEILNRFNSDEEHRILVDMSELCLENKLYFEERGYYFTPDTRIENGKPRYLAWMQK